MQSINHVFFSVSFYHTRYSPEADFDIHRQTSLQGLTEFLNWLQELQKFLDVRITVSIGLNPFPTAEPKLKEAIESFLNKPHKTI